MSSRIGRELRIQTSGSIPIKVCMIGIVVIGQRLESVPSSTKLSVVNCSTHTGIRRQEPATRPAPQPCSNQVDEQILLCDLPHDLPPKALTNLILNSEKFANYIPAVISSQEYHTTKKVTPKEAVETIVSVPLWLLSDDTVCVTA